MAYSGLFCKILLKGIHLGAQWGDIIAFKGLNNISLLVAAQMRR
jgi:hypothetical protein